MMTATYSPEDNKLRLYTSARLDADTYARVKAAGFSWAPKQELFVCPAWSPEREDLLIELCGEIGDEDTSLAERAEIRAERFDEYSDKRAADAAHAKAAVDQITGGIPLGQPILVGHHSEKRARKDAEHIENGTRKAIKLWETSQYWERRAAGAIRHAKYKELPGVRYRRIKGLEADLRKQEKESAQSASLSKAWRKDPLTRQWALSVANYEIGVSICFTLAEYPRALPASQYEGPQSLWGALNDGIITPEQAQKLALAQHEAAQTRRDRWIGHLKNRIAYERAMLGEQGGTPGRSFDLQVGGRVLIGNTWATLLRVTKKEGKAVSVSTNMGRGRCGVELIRDYQAPTAETAAATKAATKLPPMVNRSEGATAITKAEWDKTYKDYKGSRVVAATSEHGAYRTRTMVRGGSLVRVFLTDAPTTPLPPPEGAPPPQIADPERLVTSPRPKTAKRTSPVEGLRATKVQVVTAPNLFPTPQDVAARMAELADLHSGQRVLEPSAGTGTLVAAVRSLAPSAHITAVEINQDLAKVLGANCADRAHCGDFLAMREIGTFDRVVMNPPFDHGSDIKHVTHALGMLAPGGRLVAVVANGPKQQAALKPNAEKWIDLPAGTFAGTNVRAAICVLVAK